MTGKKLLSIANISRELNIPESTLHYWKNRFAEYLPSIGRGRQRRYRAETVEIFKSISELLKLGHTTRDVKAQLAEMYPLNIEPARGNAQPTQPVPSSAPHQPDMHMQTAVAVGTEIAKVLGEKLSQTLNSFRPGLPAEDMQRLEQGMRLLENQSRDMQRLRDENSQLHVELQQLRDELEAVRENGAKGAPAQNNVALDRENQDLRDKLNVLETELVRLRKDRRDMEKFLLDKISSSKER